MVMMFSAESLMVCRHEYKVVVFPLPVGPVTRIIPCGLRISDLMICSWSGGMPSRSRPSITLVLSSSRITTRSPNAVLVIPTRTSYSRSLNRIVQRDGFVPLAADVIKQLRQRPLQVGLSGEHGLDAEAGGARNLVQGQDVRWVRHRHDEVLAFLPDRQRHQAAGERFREQLRDMNVDGLGGKVDVLVALLQRQPASGLALRQQAPLNENLGHALA